MLLKLQIFYSLYLNIFKKNEGLKDLFGLFKIIYFCFCDFVLYLKNVRHYKYAGHFFCSYHNTYSTNYYFFTVILKKYQKK